MKKDIPIGLRKTIEEIVTDKANLFQVEYPKDSIVKFKDADINSDYFFEIIKINPPSNNKASYVIEYKPYDEETMEPRKTNTSLDNFKNHFSTWKKILVEANETSPIFDDTITQSYFDELEPEFEIVDNDVNYRTFTIAQQKRIVEFLDIGRLIIESENNETKESKELIEFINETKETISKSTKSQVIINIRRIIAKGYKMGLQVGEKLLIEFTTELAKKLILGPGN